MICGLDVIMLVLVAESNQFIIHSRFLVHRYATELMLALLYLLVSSRFVFDDLPVKWSTLGDH